MVPWPSWMICGEPSRRFAACSQPTLAKKKGIESFV